VAYKLSREDEEVLDAARRLSTGGFPRFTSHYFSPINGTPRPDLIGIPPDEWDLDDAKNEYVPWIPIPWQTTIAHDSRMDVTIIGGLGCGKTCGVGAVFVYWCVMQPGFKAMNCAPRGWQAIQMYNAIRSDLCNWENADEYPTYISRMIKKMIERPYPKILFENGSVIEFMSAEEQGQKIRSWSGDVISVDEAGLIEELTGESLDDLLINVGSRVRGVSRGRARLGKIIVMGNADYHPDLWDRYDMAESFPEDYMSLLITTYDNPYLTGKQVSAMERRIKDPAKRRQMMSAERPMPRGQEFTPELLAKVEDRDLDEMMRIGIEGKYDGYVLERMEKAGVTRWQLPPDSTRDYIVVGDPGQGTPPLRNSPVIGVFDVTGFPDSPCTLAAFNWIDGRGSYWPFINGMKQYISEYRPVYSAFDATGTQKSLDELAFTQAGVVIEGLSVTHMKMAYVLALKLVMGKRLMRMPHDIKGIWHQLSGWRMPDTKLRQDIASMLFMLGHLLNRMFQIDDDDDSDVQETDHEIHRVNRRVTKRHGRGMQRRRHGTNSTRVR
jgi:hypothetical protein